MILKRDYIKLSKEEISEYIQYKKDSNFFDKDGNLKDLKDWSEINLRPNYIYKHDCLFPNNEVSFLDIEEDENWFKTNLNGLIEVITDNTATERNILNYIKKNKASSLVTSLTHYTDFGHHEVFIFPEFQLSNNYQVDFLIIGRASGGYQFLLIEFENPYGKITTHRGEFSIAINKGIKQIKDWQRWIPKNFNSVHQTLKKYKGPNKDFPKEFYELDLDRFHYIIVAGRREDYNDLTYQERRETKKTQNINILHYDNLVENSRYMIKTKSW